MISCFELSVSLPLVCLPSVFEVQVLPTTYSFYMPTFTRISWILMSRDWFMVMWKETTKDCTWSCRIRAFYFREDTILRLGWIGSFCLEVCYVLAERITVLSLKLGSLVLSCLWTQRGCKEYEVQKTVSENRLRVCVLFKIHLLILPALYHMSVIKCQIHPSHWEISPAIKMPLHLFSGIEDIQPFCVASLSTLSTFPILQWKCYD